MALQRDIFGDFSPLLSFFFLRKLLKQDPGFDLIGGRKVESKKQEVLMTLISIIGNLFFCFCSYRKTQFHFVCCSYLNVSWIVFTVSISSHVVFFLFPHLQQLSFPFLTSSPLIFSLLVSFSFLFLPHFLCPSSFCVPPLLSFSTLHLLQSPSPSLFSLSSFLLCSSRCHLVQLLSLTIFVFLFNPCLLPSLSSTLSLLGLPSLLHSPPNPPLPLSLNSVYSCLLSFPLSFRPLSPSLLASMRSFPLLFSS